MIEPVSNPIERVLEESPCVRLLLPLMLGIATGETGWVALADARVIGALTTILMLLVGVVLYARRAKGHRWLNGLFVGGMFGALIGVGLFSDLMAQGRSTQEWPDGEQMWRGVVMERPRTTQKTCRLSVCLDERGNNKSIIVSVLKSNLDSVPRVGDVVAFRATMAKPYNYDHATFDYAAWLRRQGIAGVAFTLCPVEVRSGAEAGAVVGELPWLARIKLAANELQSQLINKYETIGVNEEEKSVLSAITLGEKSALSKDTRSRFSDSGTSHVLALSGLHLGIVVAFLMLLLRPLNYYRWGQWVAALLCLTVMGGFVLLTGCSVSVVRSALMFGLALLLGLRGSGFASLNNVMLAALIILTLSPQSLFDIGFQLSFLAVFALVYFMPYYQQSVIRHRFGKWVWVIDFFYVCIVAQLATAPLAACVFGRVPLMFLLANVVAIPCVYVIVVVGLLFLAFSWCPLLGEVLGWVLRVATEALLGGVGWVSGLPMSAVAVEVTAVGCVMCYSVLLTLAFWWVGRQRRYFYWFVMAAGLSLTAVCWHL